MSLGFTPGRRVFFGRFRTPSQACGLAPKALVHVDKVCAREPATAGPETWTTNKVALKLVKKPSGRTMGIRLQQQKCFDYAKFRDCEPPKDGICSYRPSFHKLRFEALNRSRTRQSTPDIVSEQEDREISKDEIRGTSSWHFEMW